MTLIQENFQVRPLRKPGKNGFQVIIHNVGPVPVHVMGAKDLIVVGSDLRKLLN